VAKTIECREGGLVCGAKVEADTEDEAVRKAIEHARKEHGVDLEQSQTLVRYLRSLVKDA
jgi:predicted small metal-binding protein